MPAKAEENRSAIEASIPASLVKSILAGRCIAFLGSGFSSAAKLPSWPELLRGIAATPAASKVRSDVESRIELKTAHAYDEAAQILEDAIGRDPMIAELRQKLAYGELQPEMEWRKTWLKNIPFRAVLTTNFDGVLRGATPSSKAYREILRLDRMPWIGSWFVTSRDMKRRPLLKLHGDLNEPETVVLTRRDYRRLLYANSAYTTFLRSVMSTNTVLYLGFSFTDAYLNELRSEILSLLGHSGGDPIAYAVSNDVPEGSRAHYSRNEGIEFLSYDTKGGADYSGFDRILKAIHDRTNPAMRYRALLAGKRLLWVDPRYEYNFRWAHDYFDMTAGREALDLVRSAPEALDRLARPNPAGQTYDLVVCFWGDESASETERGQEPLGLALLRGIRERGVGVPVVFFAERHIFQKRKRQVLEMGALGCYHRWESLLSAIQHAVDPESETI